MTQQSIAKKGIAINGALIIATVIAFILVKITNYVIEYSYTDTNVAFMFDLQRFTFIGLEVISAVAIVLAIVLFIKSNMKMMGFILLAVSASVALVLALKYVVLGIVTWVLSGLSISMLRKVGAESEFERGLNSRNSMHQFTTANPNNSFNNISNQNAAPEPTAAPVVEQASETAPLTPVEEAPVTPVEEAPAENTASVDGTENTINE
ncbi:MAG: hypothetical protein HXL76_07450 [[Eubacterium] sulci]|nr:hypothetical protein [[Eubacterium] sulci]